MLILSARNASNFRSFLRIPFCSLHSSQAAKLSAITFITKEQGQPSLFAAEEDKPLRVALIGCG
jgi:hypothetical protein